MWVFFAGVIVGSVSMYFGLLGLAMWGCKDD